MTENQNEDTVCYACGDRINDGDWVIPLDTYEARRRGGEIVLNEDNTLETLVHAECLQTDAEK